MKENIQWRSASLTFIKRAYITMQNLNISEIDFLNILIQSKRCSTSTAKIIIE